MGESHVSPTRIRALSRVCLWATLAPVVPAQGPVYREQWADVQHELQRVQVLTESHGRDRATLTTVAELLATVDDATPHAPTLRALAYLRRVEFDAAFALRGTLSAFVLPEVVDPEAQREECRSLQLSLQLAYGQSLPGAFECALEVADAAGTTVHRSRFGKGATLEDLRMAYTTVAVPAADLPDGRYRVRLLASLDDVPPRVTDPALVHTFHVLRGYEQRARSLRESAPAASAALPIAARAQLAGMVYEVERAFTGEAFCGESEGVIDLERAERAVANVGAGKPLLEGITGLVALGLPTGGSHFLSALVDRPTGAEAPRRPLVVVAAAAPAFDVNGRRPLAPTARLPRWLQRRVGDLGLGASAHVAWLQSPGAGLAYAAALPAAVASLHELLPTDGRTVLVLELEAAVALVYAPDVLRQCATAVVLVGAGTLGRPLLGQLGELPMLGVTLSGHKSSSGLEFTDALVRGAHGEPPPSRFTLAPSLPRPWAFGAAAAAPEIAAFVRALPQPK